MYKGYAAPVCQQPASYRLSSATSSRRVGAGIAAQPHRGIGIPPQGAEREPPLASQPEPLNLQPTCLSAATPSPHPCLPLPLTRRLIGNGIRSITNFPEGRNRTGSAAWMPPATGVEPATRLAAASVGPAAEEQRTTTTMTTTAVVPAVATAVVTRDVIGRRAWLLSAACLTMGWAADVGGVGGGGGGGWGRAAHAAASPAAARPAVDLSTLQEEAYLAYAERRFQDAVNLLTECIAAEPEAAKWRQMRAEALVDGKNFPAALQDFEAALGLVSDTDQMTRARLLSGRALAYEGLSEWEAALGDYRRGMDLAAEAGESLDPYVLNSIGNCLNSLGRWEEAREQYLASAAVFQQARGFRGRNGSTTPRLDGAVFSSSNAALMLAQLGDTDGAVLEMVRIARRAPGSADMRAALAALYWEQGRQREAEEMWEYACNRITVGCVKYTDLDWLARIRRWPPTMVARMADFIALR